MQLEGARKGLPLHHSISLSVVTIIRFCSGFGPRDVITGIQMALWHAPRNSSPSKALSVSRFTFETNTSDEIKSVVGQRDEMN